MLTRTTIASALTVLGASLTLSAQAPAPSPSTPARPTRSVVGAQTLANVTLVGCLYREQSVPGRTPHPAEKAGVLEDYILADASMPAEAAKNTTLATGNMYEVENIADEKLRAMVGKRVEVAGTIDADAEGDGLPEFEAASIKETTGSCPATPAPRK